MITPLVIPERFRRRVNERYLFSWRVRDADLDIPVLVEARKGYAASR